MEGSVASVVWSCATDLVIAPVMNIIKSSSRLVFICLGFKFAQSWLERMHAYKRKNAFVDLGVAVIRTTRDSAFPTDAQIGLG
ncbi:MAG: hypothetical protein A3D31_09000 [Candidatus Fluviicola riflensis]|nr:MAG: hypothetical protein CHH17_13410 [Candidatus Fluviicola riflensis]OGS77148.1 MAG: hypothetical protein A3D31_09000 [Candidatus Fluviicola riflensis]OGS82083.1 MAG: hypothetical protein A2724_17945 [Fluviicola sp. RIFCSPHIGHO2_01_FULL_43_53]OGS87777.1 MAG: hypothetical protein A3E30_15380 [Fluviicola sp. RIFCSPHIGHO2_12_FULL_43_24]